MYFQTKIFIECKIVCMQSFVTAAWNRTDCLTTFPFQQSKTSDIPVTIVFNNAGYMLTGMFADVNIEKLMANYECNATSAIRITHHFMNRILDSGNKGLIAFTSVSAPYPQEQGGMSLDWNDTIGLLNRSHACCRM